MLEKDPRSYQIPGSAEILSILAKSFDLAGFGDGRVASIGRTQASQGQLTEPIHTDGELQ